MKEDYCNGKDIKGTVPDKPIKRSSTIEQAKKAVSFYMPYNRPAWINGGGNPTKHSMVLKVIHDIKQTEARRQGVKTKAKRPLREKEFCVALKLLREQTDFDHRYKYPTMCLWQYHLIGRSDDTVHFEVQDPKGHPEFPFALQTTVRWSKNVHEERACPDQILFGAMDDTYYIFLVLGTYLEGFLERHPNAHYLFTEKEAVDLPNGKKVLPLTS